jgi:type II secretory pathway pseudopilin PulG
MLMPPQQPQNQPAPVSNSDPTYGFITDPAQKPKRRFSFSLPGGNNLTKLTLLIVAAGAIVGILIVIASSVFGSSGVNKKELVDAVAQAQEITRVSDLVSQQSRDPVTLGLASTTSTSLTSQRAELLAYLKKAKEKVSPKDVAIYLNKKNDTDLQTAAQNNRLSDAYYTYLKNELGKYQTALKTAHKDNPKGAKTILNNAYNSTQTILSTQQITTAQ